MKCPLFTIMDKRTQLGEESDFCECLKEECAWWDSEGEHCMIKSIFGELATLSETLGGIEHKMPERRGA